MDRSGEPLTHGDVTARIVAPSGKSRSRAFYIARATNGAHSPSRYTPQEPGRHEVTLACKQTGRDAGGIVFRAGGARRADRPRRASRSAGRDRPRDARQGRFAPTGWTRSSRSLAALPGPAAGGASRATVVSSRGHGAGWSRCLGLFWVGRKVDWVGLIPIRRGVSMSHELLTYLVNASEAEDEHVARPAGWSCPTRSKRNCTIIAAGFGPSRWSKPLAGRPSA